jgi:enoyl-CoA hydratase
MRSRSRTRTSRPALSIIEAMYGLAVSVHISVKWLTKATMSGSLDAARCSMDVVFPASLTSSPTAILDSVSSVMLPVMPWQCQGDPAHETTESGDPVEFVKVEITDHVATVTLDRPPVNAIHPTMLNGLERAFRSFADNREVRAVILTASGRVFSAGADLKADRDTDAEDVAPTDLLDRGRRIRETMWSIYDCPVPVIGAINGPAIGAGCGLVAMCDIIVASEAAQFGMTEVKVGLLGGASHLVLLVGPRKAREMFFTGEPIGARELERLGSVRAVVPPEELVSTAGELAERFAAMSPIALRLAKESFNRVEHLPLKEGYRIEQEYTARLRTFDDAREATLAWVERRDPRWQWR